MTAPTWTRCLLAGIAIFFLAGCQSGSGDHSASGPKLTAAERADLKWPAIPGFTGTACNLVPPAAIEKAVPSVRKGTEPGSPVVDSVSLRKGADGAGNATCTESWNAGSRRFVIDFIRRGDESRSYEAIQVQPRSYPPGPPSELYASFGSGAGDGRTTTVTVPYRDGYIELAGTAGLDVAQLTALLRIALVRASAFAPR